MKFIDNNIQDYTGTDFNVFKNPDGVTIMKFNDTQQWLSNMEQYGNLFLGGCDSCSSFYKDSFDGFSYDSVLVAGLGFGLIPQELITSKNCSKVDVVEINQEVINYNNTSGHLDSNINIIQGDIHSYTTSEMYDLIIIDTIWQESEMTEDQWQALVTRFTNNLNTNGAIYSPILTKWVTI